MLEVLLLLLHVLLALLDCRGAGCSVAAPPAADAVHGCLSAGDVAFSSCKMTGQCSWAACSQMLSRACPSKHMPNKGLC
jgi:hypothetical protein